MQPLLNKEEVEDAYTLFTQRIQANSEQVPATVGYQGGSEKVILTWHTDKCLWALFEPNRLENRYWCAFGRDNPHTQNLLSITCEINAPRSGINRQCAGLFLRDSRGMTYLGHSGKIGGGRKGIGKEAFLRAYTHSEAVSISFPDKHKTSYLIIGCIQDETFLDQLVVFVQQVADFKKLIIQSQI